MRIFKWLWPARGGGGGTSGRYGHRYFESTRKSPNIEKPFGPSAKSLSSDRRKHPNSIEIGQIAQKQSSAIALKLWPPTFGRFWSSRCSESILVKVKIALGATTKLCPPTLRYSGPSSKNRKSLWLPRKSAIQKSTKITNPFLPLEEK